MNILFISHTAMGGPFVVGSHHLAREMARQGHNVAHISSPVTMAHLMLAKSQFVRRKITQCIKGGELVDGVIEIVPFSFLPWKLINATECLRRIFFIPDFYVRRALLRHGFGVPQLILVDEPRLVDLCLLYPHSGLIYRPTDLYAEIRSDQSINEIERRIVNSGRFGVVAMSRPIAAHMQQLGARDVKVMENGVDYEFFSTPQALPDSMVLPAGPRVVYVGALDRRFSLNHVLSAAEANPDANFLLFGPDEGELAAKARNKSNIWMMGAIEYKYLPAILQQCDLALLPLSDHPANAGRSPMKIYEYGAAGLPVVATRTPELEARALSFVSLCDSIEDFAAMVQRMLIKRALGETSRIYIQAQAAEHSWMGKADVLLRIAEENNSR